MATLSTSAWVLHDLGLAAGFGGPLFGKLALHRAVRGIESEEERGKVLNDAWKQYNAVTAVSLGTAGITWIAGRALISGRSIDTQTRALVIAKDVLLGAAVVSGFACIIAGNKMGQQAPAGRVPVTQGNVPSPRTPRKAARLQRFLGVIGPLNMACTAGVIGVTAVLAMKSGRSQKWSFLSALLP
jgi:hypothetical protein